MVLLKNADSMVVFQWFRLWAPLGALLGPSWSILWALVAALGASLGVSWDLLGPLGRRLMSLGLPGVLVGTGLLAVGCL